MTITAKDQRNFPIVQQAMDHRRQTAEFRIHRTGERKRRWHLRGQKNIPDTFHRVSVYTMYKELIKAIIRNENAIACSEGSITSNVGQRDGKWNKTALHYNII
jgi:hypothetical protein